MHFERIREELTSISARLTVKTALGKGGVVRVAQDICQHLCKWQRSEGEIWDLTTVSE